MCSEVNHEQMRLKLLSTADILSPKCKEFILDLSNDDIIKLYTKIRYYLINKVVELYNETL